VGSLVPSVKPALPCVLLTAQAGKWHLPWQQPRWHALQQDSISEQGSVHPHEPAGSGAKESAIAADLEMAERSGTGLTACRSGLTASVPAAAVGGAYPNPFAAVVSCRDRRCFRTGFSFRVKCEAPRNPRGALHQGEAQLQPPEQSLGWMQE
jgi:hypothetical protein